MDKMEMPDDFRRAITSGHLRSVYEPWRHVAGPRIGPRRCETTPYHLRRTTPWIFIVDVIDDGQDFRFGFAGERLMRFIAERCATPSLAGLRDIAFFAAAERLFRQCRETARPLVSGPQPTAYKGKEHLEREVLLLPLSQDGTTVSGLLGALDTWQLGTNAHAAEPVMAA